MGIRVIRIFVYACTRYFPTPLYTLKNQQGKTDVPKHPEDNQICFNISVSFYTSLSKRRIQKQIFFSLRPYMEIEIDYLCCLLIDA